MLIVVFGPPLAGKRTVLQLVSASRRLEIQSFSASTPEGGMETGHRVVDDNPSTPIELVTFPGCLWDEQVWDPFLVGAGAIILVLDPQVTRADVSQNYVQRILATHLSAKPGCIILTKCDLAMAGVAMCTASELVPESMRREWPIFTTRMDQPETMFEVVQWIAKITHPK